MKISELSARSGVSQATIKYYIREGLLAPGLKTAPNQAQYSEQHLQRLQLVRVLRDVGGLSVDAVKSLFDALSQSPRLQVAAMAHAGLSPHRAPDERDAGWTDAAAELTRFLSGLGWQVYPDQAPFQHLVDVCVALRRAWPPELQTSQFNVATLLPYAEAAHQVASFEVGMQADLAQLSPEDLLTWVVIGTILFEPVLLALRRVAQQDVGTRRWTLPPA